MYSPDNSSDVVSDLDGKFTEALVRATGRARGDFETLRQEHPDWVAPMFERTVANIIHERLWQAMRQALDGVADFTFKEAEPVREIVYKVAGTGRTYVLRLKRHDERDRISSYPTRTDIQFWAGVVQTFDDFEIVNLAAGYRWDRETREIGVPVISYREGKSNVVWSYTLEPAAGVGTPIVWNPIVGPSLPNVDLLRASEGQDEAVGGGGV